MRGGGVHDVIVVGSGAAGGMAAFQLASAGLKVLMLEAGKELNLTEDVKTMEWLYESPRRGQLPPDEHAINAAEYRMTDRPYGTAKPFEKYRKLYSYSGNHFTKQIVVDERDHPITGTPYAWVRARVLGGKTLIWGRMAWRLSDYDFKAKTHDGFGEDWPISYADLSPYYDKVDRLLGISGTQENLPQLPDSIYQRPIKLTCGEMILKRAIAPMGRHLIPGRAGVTTDGLVHNKYRSRCKGRGRCGRGCDISASFHSPTALIYPAKDTGHLEVRSNSTVTEVLVDPDTNRATGVRIVDRLTMKSQEFKARVVVLAASCLETTRLMLNSRSRLYPNGLANSSGALGHYFCEHIMGPRASGFLPVLKGARTSLDDGRPTGMYIARFRNLTDRQKDFIRGYGFQGDAGCVESPPYRQEVMGFGSPYKREVRALYPARISIGGFGEVLARYENAVDLDPEVKDPWGVPALRFHYKFGGNELAMARDMAHTAEEMLKAARCEDIRVASEPLTEGWSIHELGTARMGSDPKSSVTNPFGQTHDVKNLFIADGAVFVSASCQNPTWTILALAWRSSDYLIEQFKRGRV